jgi:hypothetical protein
MRLNVLRRIASIIVVATLIALAGAGNRPALAPVESHADWLGGVLKRIADIKPGIKRTEFETTFDMDGGLQSGSSQRYCYRDATCIKVDATFNPPAGATEPFHDPNSTLVKLSRPYLETPFFD